MVFPWVFKQILKWQKRLFLLYVWIQLKINKCYICQNNTMCHKHKTLLGCLHITSLQANWKHPRYRLLWTHMEDIWHWCHCDPKLWTHSPCPLHFQFIYIMLMVCPCTISLPIIEKYPHDIGLLGLENIWQLPLHKPKSWWCGHPNQQLAQLSLFQLDCSTYFILRKKLESQK
jgi:hypothetical protein